MFLFFILFFFIFFYYLFRHLELYRKLTIPDSNKVGVGACRWWWVVVDGMLGERISM